MMVRVKVVDRLDYSPTAAAMLDLTGCEEACVSTQGAPVSRRQVVAAVRAVEARFHLQPPHNTRGGCRRSWDMLRQQRKAPELVPGEDEGVNLVPTRSTAGSSSYNSVDALGLLSFRQPQGSFEVDQVDLFNPAPPNNRPRSAVWNYELVSDTNSPWFACNQGIIWVLNRFSVVATPSPVAVH